jgi:hemin uptake protein HemP
MCDRCVANLGAAIHSPFGIGQCLRRRAYMTGGRPYRTQRRIMTGNPINQPGKTLPKRARPTFRSDDLFGQSAVIVHAGCEYPWRATSAKTLI